METRTLDFLSFPASSEGGGDAEREETGRRNKRFSPKSSSIRHDCKRNNPMILQERN